MHPETKSHRKGGGEITRMRIASPGSFRGGEDEMASSVRCIQKPVRIFQNTKNQCRQVGPCQDEQDKCTRQNRSEGEGEAPEQIDRLQNRVTEGSRSLG